MMILTQADLMNLTVNLTMNLKMNLTMKVIINLLRIKSVF